MKKQEHRAKKVGYLNVNWHKKPLENDPVPEKIKPEIIKQLKAEANRDETISEMLKIIKNNKDNPKELPEKEPHYGGEMYYEIGFLDACECIKTGIKKLKSHN